MRIAITGSSGFIGRAVIQSLERDGHQVVRIVRSGGGAGTVAWDIDAGQIDAAGLEGVDGVVHLAGEGIAEKRWTDEQKRRIRESRTKGTALLAATLASLDQKPAVLVSGSAVGIYGNRGDEQLTETSAPGHGFLAEVAADWEAAATPAAIAGIRVAYVRTGIVLGTDGGTLPQLTKLARFGLLGKLGSGQQWMSWISIDDQVRAIRFLLDGALAGPVNLTAPAPVTNEVLTKALGRALHRPTILPIPRFGPKLLLGAELAQTLLFDGQRVLPEALLDAGFEFRHADLETALAALLG